MFHPIGWLVYFLKNFTTILLQFKNYYWKNSWLLFLGLHDGGFLTGPYRPPWLFTQGWDRQSSDHRCTRKMLRSGVGTVITFLKVCTASTSLKTWVNTRTKHGQSLGYSYQCVVTLLSSRPGLLVLLLIFIKIFTHDLDLRFCPKKRQDLHLERPRVSHYLLITR